MLEGRFYVDQQYRECGQALRWFHTFKIINGHVDVRNIFFRIKIWSVIIVWICEEKQWVSYTHISFEVCVCWRGLCLQPPPPTWIKRGLVRSSAVSFERAKTKSLKSCNVPLSCVHLIALPHLPVTPVSSVPEAAAAGDCRVDPLRSVDALVPLLNVSKRTKCSWLETSSSLLPTNVLNCW